MPYKVEEIALFWESLDALDAPGEAERNGKAVNILTGWAIRDPLRAPPNEEGIRILKLPSTYIDGGMTRPLRLAFYLDLERQAIMLLHVEIYDEQQELLDGGTAPPNWH